MKVKTPQYELPGVTGAFNLAGESATDGAAVQAALDAAAADRAAEAKKQLPLYAPHHGFGNTTNLFD